MKISIITVCYNSAATLEGAITSVLVQTHPEIEYIIIDGASTDATAGILEKYQDRVSKIVSEPDEGIYDAMNKGIHLATGDVIGILNSDDFYASNTLVEHVIQTFANGVDMVVGDVVFVDRDNTQNRLRYINGARFAPWQLRFGWLPPHPATFVRKRVYDAFGHYKTDYATAADYEFFVRTLLVGQQKTIHSPEILVTMRDGGASTDGFKSIRINSQEILRALRENQVYTNFLFIWSRLPIKLIGQKMFGRRP